MLSVDSVLQEVGWRGVIPALQKEATEVNRQPGHGRAQAGWGGSGGSTQNSGWP